MEVTETEEWLDELVDRWSEVYKKSMTTVVLLHVIREGGRMDAAAIAPAFTAATGWSLTGRGLYRTLRRLATSSLLTVSEVPAARTGAKRKEYEVTALGEAYLQRVEALRIYLPGPESGRAGQED
ncbi:MAG: hypothetical protein HKN01_09790 [Acidimicrobiia bacterium]|nr:hypothetical protein [Acidimicrobiia bacterium]